MDFVKILTSEPVVQATIVIIGMVIALVGTKYRTNKLIKEFIPEGVEFANTLTTEDRNKLTRAITFVENAVLAVTPVFARPIVDYLINADYIENRIERFLTSKKVERLENLEKEHQVTEE